MHPFDYSRAAGEKEAVALVSGKANSQFIAGGTTLIDLMKIGVVAPDTLVDINRLAAGDIKLHNEAVMISALARNSNVAMNPLIKEKYPVLSEALLSGASAQLRNMATVGGNLMQRTRCPYFRDTTMPCNKREPGSGCPAIAGYNRGHAIFGTSDQCVAVHPSDMCVALLALDALVHVKGESGERVIPIEHFYLEPGDHPEKETSLQHGELIAATELPAAASAFARHSCYLKIRDRASFSFALVSVAACLQIEEGKISAARIALGGVATKPWRLEASEKLIVGQAPSKEVFALAAEEAIKGAKPLKYNKFKVELARRSVLRALETAWEGTA